MILAGKNERGLGGETGIRTLGRFPFNGFQDRRNRPLCHLSAMNTIATDMCLQQKNELFACYIGNSSVFLALCCKKVRPMAIKL